MRTSMLRGVLGCRLMRPARSSVIQRTELRALLSGGKHASRKLKRAQILLAADAETSDEEIVGASA